LHEQGLIGRRAFAGVVIRHGKADSFASLRNGNTEGSRQMEIQKEAAKWK
jgi:hypothetical protein